MGAKIAYLRGRGRGIYKPADVTSRAHRLRMRRKRHLKTMPSCEGCIRGNRPVCLPSSSSGRSVAETLPLSQERPPHRSPAHHRALALGSCGHAVARACARPCDRRVFCLSSLVRSQLSCTAPTETPRWHGPPLMVPHAMRRTRGQVGRGASRVRFEKRREEFQAQVARRRARGVERAAPRTPFKCRPERSLLATRSM